MWKRFSRTLRCPVCAATLQLSVFEERNARLSSEHLALAEKKGLLQPDFATYVESGLLACDACQLSFPIYKGLPVMLPYTTRLHEEFGRDFSTRLGERKA